MSICSTSAGGQIEPLVTSPDDAMRLLDCSRAKLYELLAAGELESFLEGRSRKILISSISAYIARRLAASKSFTRSRYPRSKNG
jgi:hypothetical protein